jgi:hypothetical protein
MIAEKTKLILTGLIIKFTLAASSPAQIPILCAGNKNYLRRADQKPT